MSEEIKLIKIDYATLQAKLIECNSERMVLQQENSQLKEQVQCLIKQRDDTNKSAVEIIEKFQEENSQLKKRIEKAIEYIEECIYSVDIYEQFISTNETKKLLEILKMEK